MKGDILSKLKQPAEALACYNLAIEISSNPDAWFGKAVELASLGRWEEALDALVKFEGLLLRGVWKRFGV